MLSVFTSSLPIALTLLIDLLLFLHYQRSDKGSHGDTVQVSGASPVASPPGTTEELSSSAAFSVRVSGN